MSAMKKKLYKYDSGSTLTWYLEAINHVPLLSREEEERCARDAAKGNIAARNKLVNANLRFVVNVAKKYTGHGLPFEDLISEGNIGLLKAIDRFDVEKGYHFISYAVWWIRQAILKAVYEKARMIRLPMNKVNEVVRVQRALRYVQGKESEINEIAQLLDMPPGHVETLMAYCRDMVSLENPLYDEKDSCTMGDFIEASKYFAPDTQFLSMALRNDIEHILSRLDEKEADVIRCRFGLGNKTPLSLKEIGERFNLSKERIRQIVNKAIKHLKSPSSRHVLEAYVA